MGAVNVGEEGYSQLYDELPGDLIEEILAWLPAEYLCRFATVCKQWNTLFSSTNFLRRQWAEAPPNKNPWLVVVDVENNLDLWAYSFFTRSWKKSCLSLSFLEGREVAPPHIVLLSPPFSYLGYGAGLFLIEGNLTHSIYVCNPLTAKYFILPPLTDAENSPIGETGIVEEGEDGYKVLALHYSDVHEQNIVEIYDSTDKKWTTAGLLPSHLMTLNELDDTTFGTVFSGGYFYCFMVAEDDENGFIAGIMGFNMVDGTSIFVALPELDDDGLNYFNRLFHCGSRILFMEGREFETQVGEPAEMEIQHEKEVIIWEFNKDAATKWTLLARMPPIAHYILDMIDPSETPFDCECVGIGDCLYFKKCRNVKLVVYNLTQNSWAFLPSCPVITGDLPLVAFKPRPDIKLQ